MHGFGTVVLSGTGGVGKTQLAAHHARALRDITNPAERVDLLVWANASTRDQITFTYAQAAQQLFATVPDDPEHAAQLFLTWLQSSHQHADRTWLVVWDDLADPAAVQDLWPPHNQPCGRVLVTTRRRDHCLTRQGRHLIDVDVYTPQEAHAFLADALNQAGIAHIPADLESLARDLGHLPLALGQAVTYMVELGMGCEDYLQVFHDHMTTLAEVFPDWTHPTPLAATWDLSLAQADTFHPQGVARPLVGLIAHLDGIAIPEQVLTAPPVLEFLATHRTRPTGSAPTAEVLSPHQARAALAALVRLNLITRTAPRDEPEQVLVGAHQLVQRATREHTTTCPTRVSVRTMADALVHVWPEIERDTALAQLLRANTTVLRSHSAMQGPPDQDWLWDRGGHPVLLRAGKSLGETGRVYEAVAYWQHMANTAEKHLDPDHPQTLIIRNNLAHWRGQAGDPEGAASAFRALLRDRLRILGPDDPDTLITQANLVKWQGQSGDPAGAVTTSEELITNQLRTLDSDHLLVLSTRANLAHWRSVTGDITGATAAFRSLLSDQLNILGAAHRDTLSTRANLARLQGQSGDPAGAVAAYQELITEMLQTLGPNHPDTLATRSNLAHWKGEAEGPASAVAAYQELITEMLQTLEPNHPDTLATRSNLATWTYKSGNTTKAIELFTVLVDDQARSLGPNHPATQNSRRALQLCRNQC